MWFVTSANLKEFASCLGKYIQLLDNVLHSMSIIKSVGVQDEDTRSVSFTQLVSVRMVIYST